jgi:hypothetical protein
MKASKRGLRRHHSARMKAKARRVFAIWKSDAGPEAIGRFADNLKKCSCWMCGNQRQHHGPRWQEIKAKEKAGEQCLS